MKYKVTINDKTYKVIAPNLDTAREIVIAKCRGLSDEQIKIDYDRRDALQMIRDAIVDEYDAIAKYEPILTAIAEMYNKTQDERYKKVATSIKDVIDEEKKHIGEFSVMIDILSSRDSQLVQEGMKEVTEVNDELPATIKGLLFQDSNKLSTAGPFTGFSDSNFICSLGNNDYIHFWTTGAIHQSMQNKHKTGSNFCAFSAYAITPQDVEVDFGINQNLYSAYKPKIVAEAKKYFRNN